MIAVVLDTDMLVSGMGWSGPPSVIGDAVLAGEVQLVSSQPLLSELERVLAYRKLARAFPDPAMIVEPIRTRTVADVVEPEFTLAIVSDEPDNRVLEAAVEAHVEAVVTGDGGLLTLRSYDGIPVLSAAGFVELHPHLRSRHNSESRPGRGSSVLVHHERGHRHAACDRHRQHQHRPRRLRRSRTRAVVAHQD